MLIKRSFLFVFYLFGSVSQLLLAQSHLHKSQITVNYFGLPNQSINGLEDSFGYQQLGLGFGTSLSTFKKKESLFILNGLANYSFRSMKLPFNFDNSLIHRGTLGLIGVWNTGTKNTLFFIANSHYFGDAASISFNRLQVSGAVFCNKRVSQKFQYQFGLSYSFIFGPGIPLPLLGLKWMPNEKSQLSFQFPFNLQYKEKLSKTFAIQLRVRPMGSTQFVSTRDFISTSGMLPFNATSRLRIRQFMAGIGFGYIPNGKHSVSFNLETGIMGKKNLTFQSETGNHLEVKASARRGLFFNLNIRIPLRLFISETDEALKDQFFNLESNELL